MIGNAQFLLHTFFLFYISNTASATFIMLLGLGCNELKQLIELNV